MVDKATKEKHGWGLKITKNSCMCVCYHKNGNSEGDYLEFHRDGTMCESKTEGDEQKVYWIYEDGTKQT